MAGPSPHPGRLSPLVPGVLVATSAQYLTTSTVVVSDGGGCLLVDPALAVEEVRALARELLWRGLHVVAGFSTHAHWDHLLWSADLGDVPRYATAGTAAAARAHRRDQLDELDRAAPGHDHGLFGRLRPLPPGTQWLPWPGPQALVVSHDGHAPGHAALYFPELGVLVAGDMCSDVEVPLLDRQAADPVADYRSGLGALAALTGARWVVPGHGHVGDNAELRRRLEADLNYLDELVYGRGGDDPRCQEPWLRAEHEAQLEVVRRLG